MAYLDQFSLQGRVALVTGGSYGIGFAIASALAKAGAKIAFNCRSEQHLKQALADYAAEGIEAHGYIADVTDEGRIKELVAEIDATLGTIDILVNNAGIIKRIPMTEMTADQFRQVIDVDLRHGVGARLGMLGAGSCGADDNPVIADAFDQLHSQR